MLPASLLMGRRLRFMPCIKRRTADLDLLFLRREDPTRTDDPYVPNVVRYQLRYFSIAG